MVAAVIGRRSIAICAVLIGLVFVAAPSFAQTSAVKGTGIDELLETLLTVAELHEYKANPNRPAIGTCLEAQQEAERGIVAKLLVQNGTLRVGDVVVCGQAHGRIKDAEDS